MLVNEYIYIFNVKFELKYEMSLYLCYNYIYALGDTGGVMFAVLRNGHRDQSSNLGCGCLHFTDC